MEIEISQKKRMQSPAQNIRVITILLTSDQLSGGATNAVIHAVPHISVMPICISTESIIMQDSLRLRSTTQEWIKYSCENSTVLQVNKREFFEAQ